MGNASEHPVGIVGAGPAGLAAAEALDRAGIEFEVLERHDGLGGIWDIDNPGTPMYESAHFISSKTLSGFEGYDFPDDYPDYPTRPQVLEYLRSFASERGLGDRFTYGAEVELAERTEEGWTVKLLDGGTRTYSHLVAATGHQWEPRMPAYPGEFTGEEIHSREYRSPDFFRDRRVLIVGAGNSGCDIACDAAKAASGAALSVRRGYWFVPKHMFGKPSDVFAHGGPRLPLRFEQMMLAGALKLLVGDLTNYGLPKPDHRVLESHPIMNTQVLHYIGQGDLVARRHRRAPRRTGPVRGRRRGAIRPDRLGDGVRGAHPVPRPRGLRPARHPARPLPPSVPPFDGRPLGNGAVRGRWRRLSDPQPPGPSARFGARRAARRPELARRWSELRRTSPNLSGGTHHVDSPRHDISIQDAAYQRHVRALLDELETLSAAAPR